MKNINNIFILIALFLIPTKSVSQEINVSTNYNRNKKILEITVSNPSNKKMTILNASGIFTNNRGYVYIDVRNPVGESIYYSNNHLMGLKDEIQPKTIYRIPPHNTTNFYVYADELSMKKDQARRILFKIHITYYFAEEKPKFFSSTKEYDY